jgi:hypothetical protein
MYIKNIENFGKDKLFSCKKPLAIWLEKNNIPLLAKDGNVYYFAKTDSLTEALKNVPFWISISKKF